MQYLRILNKSDETNNHTMEKRLGIKHKTRNAWQSLAYSLLGDAVSPSK